MYTEVYFNQAAFRHKVSRDDILHAFSTFIFEEQIESDEHDNKYLLLGFDRAVNLIEVMYNKIGADAIRVFHAMPCRNIYRKLIEEER